MIRSRCSAAVGQSERAQGQVEHHVALQQQPCFLQMTFSLQSLARQERRWKSYGASL